MKINYGNKKMPPHSKEVYINEFERYVMAWFIKRYVLDDKPIIEALREFADKLEGNYNAHTSNFDGNSDSRYDCFCSGD